MIQPGASGLIKLEGRSLWGSVGQTKLGKTELDTGGLTLSLADSSFAVRPSFPSLINMLNFAEQCLDLARSLLSHNLSAICEDGTVMPVEGEPSLMEESGHAALALGEYYRATGETTFQGIDLIDLAARCITAQTFTQDQAADSGMAYAALALLAYGPSQDRNPVWERLMEPTRKELDKRLLARTDDVHFSQAFNVAKAVTRFSMGFTKKDDTGKIIERFIENLQTAGNCGFVDNQPEGLGGCFDIRGLLAFTFIRQSLQLHADIHLKDRKLPVLRTYAEKYLKLLPDLVRADGLGWNFGSGVGAYGQMYCITLLLQALRDGWVSAEQQPLYQDILRRLFAFFFLSYIDQEHGFLVIRDHERTTTDSQTTRIANFDAARYLCQWARLSKAMPSFAPANPPVRKTTGRYIPFQKNQKKEQGLFIYQDPQSGLHLHLPLMGMGENPSCDTLAFPHAPGIFDWPTNIYAPILLPELTFGEHVCIPSYYGKNCTAGLGLKNAFVFKYEQPDLITWDQKIVPNLGSCKVSWTFLGGQVTSEFIFTVRQPTQLDRLRYVIALGAPHSQHNVSTTLCLGAESLRPQILKDDFQATWLETEVVSDNPDYRSYQGKIHYLQILERDHPLIMRPGQQYRLTISFQPDLTFSE